MTSVLRPTFTEGQILAAADLEAAVAHARAHAARHDRYLHRWGIAEGLTLVTDPVQDPGGDEYARVTLRAGVAIDGTGREIVVPEPVILSETAFADVNGGDEDASEDDPYPVFLKGLDEEQVPFSLTADRCGAGQPPTRFDETYAIVFGKLGEQLITYDPVAVGDGPKDDGRWPILLGYVHWNGLHFVRVSEKDEQQIGPPRAGVRAAEVIAPAGGLLLRTRPPGEAGAVLRIDDKDGFVFGTVSAGDSVTDLATVSPKGTLTVRGAITEAPRSGDVVVSSGTIGNGCLLPLPAGVDPDKVREGSVELHIWLRPHLPDTPPPLTPVVIDTPVVCAVDSERRVECLVRRVTFADGEPTQEDVPASADFLMLAVAATEKEG